MYHYGLVLYLFFHFNLFVVARMTRKRKAADNVVEGEKQPARKRNMASPSAVTGLLDFLSNDQKAAIESM